MKNPISFLLLFLITTVTCFSQSIVPRSNSSYTVMDSRFKAQYNLFVPAYADTTAANLQIGVDSLGAVIFTYDNMSLMVRSGSPKVWTAVGSGSGGSGTVESVTGTADRITITGTPTVNPTIDIASTYVGQSSITTLGTIATGVWNGTAVGFAYGGTGLSTLGTANQLLRVNAGATALEYFTPTYVTTNIYAANGTLAGDRVVDANTNDLSFSNGGVYAFSTSTATSSPDANAAMFVDGGTLQYAAEFVTSNSSFSGFAVRSTLGTAAPFVQLINDGNSKIWTTMLETDNSFSIREGAAAGTQRIKIAPTTGNITLSSLAGNGSGIVAVDNNGVLSWSAASGGTPGGSYRSVQINGGASFSGTDSLLWENGQLVIAGTTETANNPLLLMSQTWNNGAVTFNAIDLEVTNTASAAASNLINLKVGGTSIFSVTRGAVLDVNSSSGSIFIGGNSGFIRSGNTMFYRSAGTNSLTITSVKIQARSDGTYTWSSTTDPAGTVDVALRRLGSGSMGVGSTISNTSGRITMAGLTLEEGAAPSTPASGFASLYVKTDGFWYGKDDAGSEKSLMQGFIFTPANSTDATYPNGTMTVDDDFIYFRTSTGTWKKVAFVAF